MSVAFHVAQLRHLYAMMIDGRVRDTAEAARGLLAPAVAAFERAAIVPFDGIRTAALALPEADRNALRMALAASLPIPRCFDTSPALMAKAAQTMTAAEVEELIGLLTNRRPS